MNETNHIADDGKSLPAAIDTHDVERMVALLGEAVSARQSLLAKRAMVFEAIAKLVDADIWIWLQSRAAPGQIVPAPFGVAEGGFRDDEERNRFHQANFDPKVNERIGQWLDQRVTLLQNQMFPNPPTKDAVLANWQTTTGLADCILSVYPLGNHSFSAIGLHRRKGSPPFEPRHRAMVHVMFGQLDFLHRPGADVAANNNELYELTPREQQVLMYLLAGDQAKQVASKTQLSVHTVNDYVKRIYRHFSVSTRAELLTLFRSGGLPEVASTSSR